MQSQSLPLWISVLSALLTPTIAVIGSAIAYLQWKLARQKVNLELFEMRYELLRKINAPLYEISIWKPSKPKIDGMAFLKLLNEGHFVFGREADPVLTEILNAFNKFYPIHVKCINADGITEDLFNRLKSVREPLVALHAGIELRLVDILRII